MFDLETSIATWRHSLRLRKVLLDEDLEELEQHVRDQVRTLKKRGFSEEEAFRRAMKAMGHHGAVEDAYKRVYWGKLKRKGMLRTTIVTEARMWKNYATVALRNLLRHPGYTFINVAGLAVGIACCLLIVLFVRDELAFDRFHEHADRIVRVTLQVPELDRDIEVTPTIVAPLFKRTFPEVEEATRIYDIGRFRKTTIRRGDQAWQESGFMYADSTVFDVFTFPFVAGSPETALNRPRTLVLTESAASLYFDDPLSAVGEVLTVSSTDYEVTGVIEDVPTHSHLRFNMLGSFVSTSWASREIWNSANFYTYLLRTEGTNMASLRTNVDEQLVIARRELGLPDDFGLGLQPLGDIYMVHMGRERYVWIFSALALLLLGIACVNYMNLSTARSARRGREVGMRKVLGAHRGQIMRQFFGESAMLTSVSFILGLGLAALVLPLFNAVSLKDLHLGVLVRPEMIGIVAVLLVCITVGAGIYPSFLLSAFRPATVLKGGRHAGGGKTLMRKVLVVFQFAVTVFLLVAVAVVFRQLRFIQTADVGFDREQVVVIPLADGAARQALPTLRDELSRNPSVIHTSAMNAIPGDQQGGYSLWLEPDTWDENSRPRIAASPVDPYPVETLGLDLIAGRGFSDRPDYLASPDSARYEYVINESLAALVGWTPQEAIGQRMSVSGAWRMGDVVGVIRDYNFLTLREQMYPFTLFVEPEWNVFLVKIAPTDVPATLAAIRNTWNEVTSGSPFNYTFLDEEYAAFYESERRLGQIFAGATILAVLIACLGLFGLASYTAEARTKEIGIRKALGASVPGLISMLNREFTWLVLAGFVIAVPLAYWAAVRWLESFAFRAGLSWWIFALTGIAALAIAWITVSYQSIRAATSDPVETLRYE